MADTAPTGARTPPGPDGLPVLGSTLAASRDGVAFAESLDAYGDVVSYRAFGQHFVSVSHPDLVEAVLVSRNDEFRKGDFEQAFGDLVAPDGLAFVEGDRWRRQRLALQSAFRPAQVATYADAMVAETARLVDDWADGDVVDLRDSFSTLGLRILARTLLDVDLGGDRGAVVRRAVESLADVSNALGFLAFLPDWLPTRVERRHERAMADLSALVTDLVAARRENPGAHDDLLATMLTAEYPDGGRMDADTIHDQVVTFLFAGHETTATALTYAVALLADHPDVRARLDDECRTVLGDRDPEFADYPALDYTRAVADEAMRLYPPIYAIYRQPRTDTTLGDYRIPADATLQLASYNVHRDDRWWDDPTAFRPDRWLTDDADRPEYAYFPFGGGPRHCIGMRFARTELVLALATLARRVDFERRSPLDPEMAITLDPGTVEARVEKR